MKHEESIVQDLQTVVFPAFASVGCVVLGV